MKKSYLLLLLTSVIAADPELYFIEPKDGETYPKEVAVKFGLKDFGVAPAGYNIPNTGHHHLIINADLPDNFPKHTNPPSIPNFSAFRTSKLSLFSRIAF